MGACGCNETNGVYRIPGKNNTQYVVGHHVPCQYCNSPIAVTIDKLNKLLNLDFVLKTCKKK